MCAALIGLLMAGMGSAIADAQRAVGHIAQAPAATQTGGTAPEVHVEFFGAERGYAVGGQNVTLLCILRNVGTAPLPANTLRARCFTVAGLDYTSGETRPLLPALERNQAIAFRWRLSPNEERGPLVAAVLIESAPVSAGTGSAPPTTTAGSSLPPAAPPPPPVPVPQAVLAVIPRFASQPRVGSQAVAPGAAPRADAQEGETWVGNDRVLARIVTAERRQPALLLAAREGMNWRTLATALPLAAVRACEEGQRPWWETFRWRDSRVSGDKDTVTLTLLGSVGTRWRAELTLEARRDTAALNGRLRLSPLRVLRLYGVQLPRLLPEDEDKTLAATKADGSPIPVPVPDAPLIPETSRVAAVRQNGITFGLAWPSAPLAGWRSDPLPGGDSLLAPVLGAQYASDERGSVCLPGSTLEFTFRLFAFGPSDTLRDALRFALP